MSSNSTYQVRHCACSVVQVQHVKSRVILSPVGGGSDLRASIHRGLECVRSQLPSTASAEGYLEMPDVGVVLPRGASDKEFREASRTILLSAHRWDKYLQEKKRHKRCVHLLFNSELCKALPNRSFRNCISFYIFSHIIL